MAHAGLTIPEGNAINAFSSISTEHISSPQTTFQSNIEMPITRSPSPSQPRASWRRMIQHGRISSPTIPNEDLPSRDSSQSRNYTHTPFDWGTRLERTSRSEHPYFDERYADALRLDDAPPSQREASSTPPGEPGQKITPASTIASISDHGELSDQLAPNSPRSIEKSNEDKPPSHSSVAAESNLEPDSEKSKLDSSSISPELVPDDDNDMDDEESDMESEEDHMEERWRSTEEAFEASVIRATGNNLELAAPLIPKLYEMFQQEQSSVIGFWETCYRQRGESPYVQGSGTQGGNQTLAGYSGQDINIWNRQREGDEGNRDDNHNNQGGDGDGNRNSTKDNKADIARKFHLACPFNKRQPEIYNRFHRSPGGKGEYNICESGIPSDKDFKEHLNRKHRCVQCENCGQKFVGKPKQRSVKYLEHQAKLGECSMIRPELREGMTALQWSRIDALGRQTKSTAFDGNLPLSVRKWYQVWNILFPGEIAPSPYFASPSSQSQTKESIFDREKGEFRKCFKSVLDISNSETSLEEKGDQAFVLWWAKWHAKQDALQQTQQRPSHLQDNCGFQAADSPESKGAFDQAMQFPDTSSPQEGSEVANTTSFSHSQQQHPTAEGRWGMVPARRRVASAPIPGPRYEDLPILPQLQGPMAPSFRQPQEQQPTYQPVYFNPNMPSGNGAQQNPQSVNPVGLAIRGHNPPFGEYNGPQETNNNLANPFQDNNFADFPMTEAPQMQPIYSAQVPQPFTQFYLQRLPSHPASQPLGGPGFFSTAPNQVFPPQSMESQQGTFNYPNQNLPRSNLQNSARFYDPNARENQYES